MSYKIYNCKVFRNSSRQSKIISAMQNSNLGLAIQLPDELDNAYRSFAQRPDSDLDHNPDEPQSSVEDNPVSNDDKGNSLRNSFSPSPSGSVGDISFDDLMDAPEEEEGESNDYSEPEIDDTGNVDEEAISEDNIEETTRIDATAITANSNLSVDVIKGSLNNNSETCGVNRILCKESELWIYYEDSINLNNIMSSVIMYLNSAGFTNLEFNRLARSENAIVFQITCCDTNNIIHSIKDDANE